MILAATIAMAMAVPALAIVPTEGSITLYKYEKLENDSTPANGEYVDMGDRFALKNVPFELELTTLGIDELDSTTDPATVGIDSSFTKRPGTTDANGMLAFTGLPLGVYRVTETAISSVTSTLHQFLVSVPMTKADGSGWNYDVKVYPKNVLEGGPEIEKTVDKASATVGEIVTWTITSDIPDGIDAAEKYEITDQLDARLTYDAATAPLAIKVGATPISGAVVALDTDTNILTIDLTPAKTEIVAAMAAGDTQIVITLPTRVNSIGDMSAIENVAELSYTNEVGKNFTDSSEDETDPDSVPKVDLGGFQIFKMDEDEEALAGAHFALYATGDDGELVGDPITGTVDAETGVYLVDVNAANALDIVSGADGKAVVKGLAYGNYLLVETQAPVNEAGKSYNLLLAPVAVTVNADSLVEGNIISIMNKMGFMLPITGGMGTTLFTLAGILLLGGAAFVLLKKDKKTEAK